MARCLVDYAEAVAIGLRGCRGRVNPYTYGVGYGDSVRGSFDRRWVKNGLAWDMLHVACSWCHAHERNELKPSE